MKTSRVPRLLVAVVVAALTAPRLSAQAGGAARVNHIKVNYLEGEASLQSRNAGEWVKVAPGDMVKAADNFWVDQNSRVELLMGELLIGVDSETSLTVERADEKAIEFKLWLGSIMVRFPGPLGRQVGIATPNSRFALNQPGEYRLDVNPPGDESIATVWRGELRSTGSGASYLIHASERAELRGTDKVELEVEPASRTDDFDQWAFRRDQIVGPLSATSEPGGRDAGPGDSGDENANARPEDSGGIERQGTIPIGCHRPWCELDAHPDLQLGVEVGFDVWWPGLPCDPWACGPVVLPYLGSVPAGPGLRAPLLPRDERPGASPVVPRDERPSPSHGADGGQIAPFPPPAAAAGAREPSRVSGNREDGAAHPLARPNRAATTHSSPPAAKPRPAQASPPDNARQSARQNNSR